MGYSLSREQEKELAVRIQNGDESALETLVVANTGMVKKLARQYAGYGLSFDDLVQEGMLGLLEAAKTFDPTYDNKFLSYAIHYVRKNFYTMYESESVSTNIPKDAVWLAVRMNRAIDRFIMENERYPRDDELLKKLKWKPSQLKKARLARQHKVDIDAEIYDGDKTFHDTLTDVDSVSQADSVEEVERYQILFEMLSKLPETDRYILYRMFGFDGDETTLTDIALELGMSKQAVWYRKTGALRKLRAMINLRKKIE